MAQRLATGASRCRNLTVAMLKLPEGNPFQGMLDASKGVLLREHLSVCKI